MDVLGGRHRGKTLTPVENALEFEGQLRLGDHRLDINTFHLLAAGARQIGNPPVVVAAAALRASS